MNIICCTEKAAQSLERAGLPETGEKLRQDVSHILYLAKKKSSTSSNLTNYEKKV